MTPLRIAILFFVTLGLPILSAAEVSTDTPGTFRLLAVHSGGDGIVNSAGLKYESSSKRPPVTISMGGNLSRPYTRPTKSEIVFFEEITPPPDTTGKTGPVIRQPRLSVTLPDDNLPYLIVVTAAPPGSPLPLIGRVFRADAEAHPASSLRIINLTPEPAAASIDSQNLEIGPYVSRIVTLNPPTTGNTKFLRFQFGAKQHGDWSVIHDEFFRFRPEYRMYALILNVSSPDEERVKIFFERPPVAR